MENTKAFTGTRRSFEGLQRAKEELPKSSKDRFFVYTKERRERDCKTREEGIVSVK